MIKNRDSLKAKVSNMATIMNIPNQYLIQSFMFEALLKRISLSNYRDKYLELIRDDLRLKFLWNNYQKNYEYAQNISFEDTVASIRQINEVLMLFSVGV